MSHSILLRVSIILGMAALVAGSAESDDQVLRKMVAEAVNRMNLGDVETFRDFWDEEADYVGVDGRLLTGRKAMEDALGPMIKAGAGKVTQNATIERVRFVTPDLAIVDGSWTITGAVDAAGKQLGPIRGRGMEVAQKKHGQWRFVATREIVIFQGNNPK